MEDNLDKFEENTALFDAYLRGEMPPPQRAEFEARLATDASLQSDFDLHRALLGSMGRNWERERLRGQVQEARQATRDQGKNTGGGQGGKRFLLPLAAILLLLIAGGSIWYFWPEPEPPPNNETRQKQDAVQPQIAPPPVADDQSKNIGKPPPPSRKNSSLLALAERSRDRYMSADFGSDNLKGDNVAGSKNAMNLAREAFDRKNWSEAVRLYESVPRVELQQYSARYACLGMAYLQNRRWEEAIPVFQFIRNNQNADAVWQERAEWYLLLAYAGAGESQRHEFENLLESALEQANGDHLGRLRELKAVYEKQ